MSRSASLLARHRALAAGARSAGERVVHAVHAARILEKMGDPAAALAELRAVAGLVPQVDDPDDRELWEIHHAALRVALGAREPSPTRNLSPLVGILEGVAQRWSGADRSPTAAEIADLAAFAKAAAVESPVDHPTDRRLHAILLVQQAVLTLDRPAEARSLLDRADALLATVEDAAARTESALVRARLQASDADPDGAEALYRKIWPRVLTLPPANRAVAAGFRLEALGKAGKLDVVPELLQLAEVILRGLDEALREAPGGTAAARLRVRGELQRPLETALLALLDAARRPGIVAESSTRLFAGAWQVVLAAHDPELAVPAGGRRPATPEIAGAEAAFHRLLGRALTLESGSLDYSSALRELLEVQLTSPQDAAAGTRDEGIGEGDALAVFPVRDLVPEPLWVVLWRRGGRHGCRLIRDPELRILSPLRIWAAAITDRRAAHRHLAAAILPEARSVSTDELLALAAEILPVPARPPSPDPGRECDGAWDLYLDGPLATLPLEALPATAEPCARLGYRFALRHRLRPRNLADERPDLSRGWLGVGVAQAGRLPRLAGAESEIQRLSEQLRRRDVRAVSLLGARAVPDRVVEELTARRPSVVHFACHGVEDHEHPEACTLVLAPPEEDPDMAILPFRRIRTLPLAGVDLVVLSACRSASGRSARGAPLRGLAWAFLDAGASQVLASRIDVADETTPGFMMAFYRHLTNHPAAEALRRTRAERAADGGYAELATWAIWA